MKYHIRVCRPRFEFAVVEVDAADDAEAEQAAVVKAESVKKWKLAPFDPDQYDVLATTCITDAEIEEFAGKAGAKRSPEDIIRKRYLFEHPDRFERYVTLWADLDSGEGRAAVPIWMIELDELLLRDLVMDWVGDLLRIVDPDGPPPDNVIPFSRRPRDSGD